MAAHEIIVRRTGTCVVMITIFAMSQSGTMESTMVRGDRCFAAVSLSLIGYAATKPRIKLFRSEHLTSPRICIDDLFSCAKMERVSQALQFSIVKVEWAEPRLIVKVSL